MNARAADGTLAALRRRASRRAVAFLREIVRVPSDTPPGDNAPAAERAARLLERLGYTVERHPVPDGVPARLRHDERHQPDRAPALRHGGPTIALNAHGDVVPPGEGWTKPPYEGVVENGRMYGARRRRVEIRLRDATRTRSRRCARCARDGARLNGTVELHFTYDEEFGGAAGPRLAARAAADPARLTRSPRASRTRSSPRTTAACSSRSRCTARPRTARCRRPASMRCAPRTRS